MLLLSAIQHSTVGVTIAKMQVDKKEGRRPQAIDRRYRKRGERGRGKRKRKKDEKLLFIVLKSA